MDTFKKIGLLAEAAKYDVCMSSCLSGGRKPDPADPVHRWIYPAVLPNGRTVPILKILMDNVCENNCTYCIHRRGRDHPTASLTPEELANIFMGLVRGRLVHGLFLSSAISSGPNKVMEKMIRAVEIIREKQKFSGYIHLKILPGANLDYVERAVELANRVSLNLEAPNRKRLAKIAPEKVFIKDLLKPMEHARDLILQGKGKARSQTTQFVVGASGESDNEILKSTAYLYKNLGLWRAYFSAFQPVPDTPLENHPPTPLVREHRLYQTDFLLRQYGFKLSEVVFCEDGNLPQKYDPKMAWALAHPERFPIEVNKAEYGQLLRIPGIGPVSAKRISKLRRKDRFHNLEELKATRMVLKRALPFILVNGRLASSL